MTFTFLTAGLVFAAGAHGVAVLLLALEHAQRRLRLAAAPALLSTLFGGLLLSRLLVAETTPVIAAGVVVAAVAGVAMLRLADYRPSGALLCGSYFALVGFGLLWSGIFLTSIHVSDVTRSLMVASAAFGLILLPSMLVQNLESWEVLVRRTWRRPSGRRPAVGDFAPRIEIQVPTHDEPPQVVRETLDRLSELDYANFSVLVIDNNTADPAVWEPVQRHCRELGERFRFVHREGLTGAKAGALNHVLAEHSDPEADLIAVVDADYHVEPDWLSAVVGHFQDEEVGFVQTPHAYRDWHNSLYQRMCAWEYAFFFHTTMRALNEHRSALTVGTMCVIRRKALVDAGGWAEWCLTEDSELAIRIHALGYSSVYMTETFGRGLIPETFGGYKKQRFRWTYGPIQEFKAHARLFLPGPWRRPSALSRTQRIHHGNHGIDRAGIGLALIAMPLLAATISSMVLHGEHVRVPVALWVASTVLAIATLATRFLTYRVAVGASVKEALGGIFAAAALSHVISVASAMAIIGRTTLWRRTDKFRAKSSGLRALGDASAETVLAVVFMALAAGAFASGQGGIITMLAIGFTMTALSYLAAPAIALLADRDVSRARAREALVIAASEALTASASQAPTWEASTVMPRRTEEDARHARRSHSALPRTPHATRGRPARISSR